MPQQGEHGPVQQRLHEGQREAAEQACRVGMARDPGMPGGGKHRHAVAILEAPASAGSPRPPRTRRSAYSPPSRSAAFGSADRQTSVPGSTSGMPSRLC